MTNRFVCLLVEIFLANTTGQQNKPPPWANFLEDSTYYSPQFRHLQSKSITCQQSYQRIPIVRWIRHIRNNLQANRYFMSQTQAWIFLQHHKVNAVPSLSTLHILVILPSSCHSFVHTTHPNSITLCWLVSGTCVGKKIVRKINWFQKFPLSDYLQMTKHTNFVLFGCNYTLLVFNLVIDIRFGFIFYRYMSINQLILHMLCSMIQTL